MQSPLYTSECNSCVSSKPHHPEINHAKSESRTARIGVGGDRAASKGI